MSRQREINTKYKNRKGRKKLYILLTIDSTGKFINKLFRIIKVIFYDTPTKCTFVSSTIKTIK